MLREVTGQGSEDPSVLSTLDELRRHTTEGLACVYLTAPWYILHFVIAASGTKYRVVKFDLCRCAFCRLFEPKYFEFRRFYPQAGITNACSSH